MIRSARAGNYDALLREGATVAAYDPAAMTNVRQLGGRQDYSDNQYDCLKMPMPGDATERV